MKRLLAPQTLVWALLMTITVLTPSTRAATPIPLTVCPAGAPTFITSPGNYQVTDDATCTGDGILVLADRVDLDLNGHTIVGPGDFGHAGVGTWTGMAPFGIFPAQCNGSTGLHVHNGTITGFYNGVLLCAPGPSAVSMGAKVDHMKLRPVGSSTAPFGLVMFFSSENTIETNDISGAGVFGIFIEDKCANNSISGNLLNGNGSGIGFAAFLNPSNFPSQNKVYGNLISNSVLDGVFLYGEKNSIQSNFVTANRNGIHAGPDTTANQITGNTAFDNGTDLKDDSGVCFINTWQANFFGTGSPSCIN